MSDYDIHSCGYYCDRHACIKRQRDELRDKLFVKEWVGFSDEENLSASWTDGSFGAGWKMAEAKLKEKNLTSERSIQTSDTKPAELMSYLKDTQ